MSKDEKSGSASSLLSSASDRRQRAAIPIQGRFENDGEPPGVSSTTTTSDGRFNEELSRQTSITDARVLLRPGETSRGAEESARRTTTVEGSSKNRHRFDLAYEKYYSASNDLDQVAACEKALFSKAIIAVEKSTRGVQRPEKCKEYQPRCSSADNFVSVRARTESASPLSNLQNPSKRPETLDPAMPAAFTCSSMDSAAATSKIANLNANVSLPPSPQRSSSSSTSDGGSSAFLAMAKRLHRLRLAAASPHRGNVEESITLSKETVHGQEFISIEPLAAGVSYPTAVDDIEADQMPPISTSNQNDQRSPDIDRQTSSVAPSLSDVSIASFYRLPPAQVQTSDAIAFQRQHSSSSLGRSKVWSSEPVLASEAHPDPAKSGQFGLLTQDYHGHEGRSPLDAIDGRKRSDTEHLSVHLDPGNGNLFSSRYAALINSLERNGLSGGVTDRNSVQDRRFMEPPSWLYPSFPREPFPVADVPDPFGINAPIHTNDVGYSSWSRATVAKDSSGLPSASLPPLPPGKVNSRNGLSHPPLVKNAMPSSSNAENGEAKSAAEYAQIPDTISRLMEAVSKHPASELDYSKLKTILREQRKSYKRRLEKEKAKREALEDLLVKLNSTPRIQHHSFSNASSTASTVRHVSTRAPAGGNGRTSADLADVILNSIRSSSFDGNSSTSEDAFLLELIQQHLRMKQALLGHLGKRTTGSSSTSGGENDGRDQAAAANRSNDLKLTPHSSNGVDDDDIPMGGEAASGAPSRAKISDSTSARLANGQPTKTGDLFTLARPKKSRSVDFGQGAGLGQLNGLIDKDALKLMLDSSSTGGSENGARSSSSERRKQRKKWETNASTRTDREHGGQSTRMASGRAQGSARSSVAFFVPANVGKNCEPQSALREIKEIKPLPNIFRERQSKFIQRSISRQDKIKAASELRSETERRIRELADNVAHGRMRMEDASEQLLLYELPQPSAFSRLEMFRASKLKYEQLPETVARRNKLKKEADLATNRVMAKMFKQKLAYKRFIKAAEKQSLISSVPPSVVASNGPPSVRLLNR